MYNIANCAQIRNMKDCQIKDLFSSNVKKYREASKKTQAEIAEEIDVSVRHYQRIEKCDMIPSILIAYRISKALDVPLDALFSEKDKA